MLNMQVPIQLPAPTRRTGGLFVDVAVQLDVELSGRNRLGSGVVHVPWGCDPMFPGNAEICMASGELSVSVQDGIDVGASGLVSKDLAIRSYPDQVVHPPFKIVDGLECGSLTGPTADIRTRLETRMDLQLSKMLMAEMVSGNVSGGVSLVSAGVNLPASSSVAMAAVRVESWLASVLHNGVGVVVLPVGLLAAASSAGWIDVNTLRTRSGHYVIADAGFTGDPANPIDETPASYSVFGMGLPGYAFSDPKLLDVVSGSSNVSISDNMIRIISEAYAQIAFDPCSVGETVVAVS